MGLGVLQTISGIFHQSFLQRELPLFSQKMIFRHLCFFWLQALQLADVAKKVYWIYREQKPAAMPSWQEQVRKGPKIEEISETNVKEIRGKISVEKIILDREYNGKKELTVQGLFVQIGAVPSVDLARDLGVKLNEHGYIKVDEAQKTNTNGVYAAGDVTSASNRFKQIITACSEGAIAAHSVYEYLKK